MIDFTRRRFGAQDSTLWLRLALLTQLPKEQEQYADGDKPSYRYISALID